VRRADIIMPLLVRSPAAAILQEVAAGFQNPQGT
jgi:hypothetical protein